MYNMLWTDCLDNVSNITLLRMYQKVLDGNINFMYNHVIVVCFGRLWTC